MNRNVVLSVSLIVIFTFFIYYDVLNIFYQQDEWQTIGNNITLSNFWDIFSNANLLSFISVQERFASNVLSYFLMGKNAFTINLMGVYSIFFHLVNTILVFTIVRKWVIKDSMPAALAAIFFAVSSVSLSAVSWFGTSLGTLPAVTLILLALFFYFLYIQKGSKKWITLALVTLYASFFFKEIGIFLLTLLPLALFVIKSNKASKWLTCVFAFVFFLVVALRVINLVYLSNRSGELFVTSSQPNLLPTVFTRAIMYPLTSFSLTFLPPVLLISTAKSFTNIYYPTIPSQEFNLVAQTAVLDLLATIATFTLIILLYLSTKKEDIAAKKMTMFWIIFFFLSFMPYILLGKTYAYLESRYYYLGNLPAGILLAMLTTSLKKYLDKKNIGIIAVVLAAGFLMSHSYYLKKDLSELVLISKERKEILSKISKIKPSLDQKNLFYLESNHDYYIPGNYLPFQQGLGYTLMVWYYHQGKVPKEFIEDKFLWNINTQGYKELNGFGFGFVRERDELEKIMREHNLSSNQITYLYYDYVSQKLEKRESLK